MNEVSTNNQIASQPEPAEVEADESLPTIDHVPNEEIRDSADSPFGTPVAGLSSFGKEFITVDTSKDHSQSDSISSDPEGLPSASPADTPDSADDAHNEACLVYFPRVCVCVCVSAIALWGAEPVENHEEIGLIRLDANETIIIPFTSDLAPVKIHYCAEPEIRSYVRCHGSNCILCQSRPHEGWSRFLLPVVYVPTIRARRCISRYLARRRGPAPCDRSSCLCSSRASGWP